MQPEGPATDARTARTFHVSVGADAAQISARKGIPYGLRTPRRRNAAGGPLRVRGGRLNHRVVSVLRVIAANPGLSNNDIALRVGIEGKGDASTLLSRLARFGLIENTPTRGRENEWQLTAAGKELETAIRDDSRRVK
jgi:hypothetical protein